MAGILSPPRQLFRLIRVWANALQCFTIVAIQSGAPPLVGVLRGGSISVAWVRPAPGPCSWGRSPGKVVVSLGLLLFRNTPSSQRTLKDSIFALISLSSPMISLAVVSASCGSSWMSSTLGSFDRPRHSAASTQGIDHGRASPSSPSTGAISDGLDCLQASAHRSSRSAYRSPPRTVEIEETHGGKKSLGGLSFQSQRRVSG